MQSKEISPDSPRAVRNVTLAGWAMCLLFVSAGLIWDRSAGAVLKARPILAVLGIYLAAFAAAFFALRTLLRSARPDRLIPIVIVFGLSFRLIQLFSTPFLEIDIYRYMWDGIVVSNGTSPYVWSPNQALSKDTKVSAEQQEIIDLAASTETVHRIVSKVHFADYTTIYPPVSQVVFGATMWVVPDDASVATHLRSMKLVLVCFDVGTMLLLLSCLRIAGRNPGWVAAYAWNPLVIKEIANSGHLDSIATFFLMAAVVVVLRELKRGDSFRLRTASCVGGLLSLGAGAKLFPVVLVPLFASWIWRRSRTSAATFAVVATVVTLLLLSPMLVRDVSGSRNGLTSFLAKWQMNSVVYSAVYENVRLVEAGREPWYSVVPVSARESLQSVADSIPGSLSPATKLARGVTLCVFACVYLCVLVQTHRQGGQYTELPSGVFCILTVFLFLQPTVNPWYWLWAVPFACFARNPGWHIVGAGLLIYYSRFWFKYSGLAIHVGGMRYVNADCFDHFVVWVEHVLIVVGVVAGFFLQTKAIIEPDRKSHP